MIMHLIKYNLKVFSKNMELIFWMFFFPIFIMTMFGNTLGNVKLDLDLKEETVYVYVDNTPADELTGKTAQESQKTQDNMSANDNNTSTNGNDASANDNNTSASSDKTVDKEENIILQKASAYNDKIYHTYIKVLGSIFEVKEISYSKPEDLNEAL